jgi:predicted negative regulator of RcsB-dependent stress response
MDKKTFFLVLLGVMGMIGYLGWREYQKSIDDERQFRIHLQQDEQ